MFYLDWTFFILIPAMVLAFYAQHKVNSTFKKFSRDACRRGYTGAQAAAMLLERCGVRDVPIERVRGNLSDHYDPRKGILRLSDGVYASSSIAAVGVAAHEAGHAIQHNQGYAALSLRNGIFPVARFGSNLAYPLIIVGLLLTSYGGDIGHMLLSVGVVLFGASVAFQLVTLPVEFNASRRAMALLTEHEILDRDEIAPARKVLSAAALTYVASAAVAVANLLQILLMLSGNRRRG